MKNKRKTLLLPIFVMSGIMMTACSIEPTEPANFKLVKTMPISDSDKSVQIVEDSQTGVQYIVDNGNWVVREGK